MGDAIQISGRAILSVELSLVLFLLLLARISKQNGSGKQAGSTRRRPPCGIDERGEPLLFDPDGMPSEVRRFRLEKRIHDSP